MYCCSNQDLGKAKTPVGPFMMPVKLCRNCGDCQGGRLISYIFLAFPFLWTGEIHVKKDDN